ncbi:peptidase domain-containing ABC transporter [Denitromonas iodatirespirans]|uniref:Cyclolysin secretion/processing ATP-binding protein CyaB n=1 Tax=Denitromonas iodatirespirans TaxID=2795389 RepID=A0A944H7U9_DENI1|nr:peptidase domain-containing ABC transporter [Denitromonas iodatirespirans]MBT0960685.1 peptidase domain-containing ABC transporter [Denitromonas iodatirespirans]
MSKLPVFLQMEANECGLASLAMIAAYHGHVDSLAQVRRDLPVSRKGATVRGLLAMADVLGLSARAVKLDVDELPHLQLPCILHWDMEHFVVLRAAGRRSVVIHDPAVGVRRVSMREFGRRFTGVALECEPHAAFEQRPAPRAQGLRDWFGRVPGLRRGLTQIVLLTGLLELVAVLMPFLLQWVVDDALPARGTSLLDGLVVGFALLVLIGTLLDIARGWLAVLVSMDLNLRWTARVLAHLLRLPLDFFERRHAGDIASCFGSITIVQHTFTTGFIEALVDGALVLGTLAMMTWYSPVGAALALGGVLLYALVCVLLHRPLRQASAEEIVQVARQQSHFLETLRGIQGIRLFARAEERQRGWAKLIALQTNAELRVQGLRLTHQTTHRLLFELLRVLVIWLAAHAVLSGSATLGLLFAFLAYLDQFTRRTGALIDRLLDLALLRLHVDRVGDIVQTPVEPPDPSPPAAEPDTGPPRISVHGLRYAYAFAEEPVLDGVDLEIEAGECVALTGPSGCGKTTLVKLLMGLLEPTHGEIRVDGAPLAEFGRNRLRAMAGTVMQDDVLFTGSLADNICFFDPEPDFEHMRHCAQLAALHDDIENMPMGYDTLVGEVGVGLSGGQKQRVMLARALYRRPRLLVLDEATSHLDVFAERNVNEAIRRLALTRIVVAHRPETIAMADRVIEMAHGRVVRQLRALGQVGR